MLQAIDIHLVDQPGPSLWITGGLPLLGVLLGAVVAGGVRLLLDRRADRAHFRAAIWMLVDDLQRMHSVLDTEKGPRTPLGTPQSPLHADTRLFAWLRSEAWISQRETLARGLQSHPQEWDQLRFAMTQVDVLERLYEDHESGVDGDMLRRMATHDELGVRVSRLIAALEPHGQRPRKWWRR